MQKCPNLFLAALQGREGFIFGRLTGQLGLQKCPNLFLAALQGRSGALRSSGASIAYTVDVVFLESV
jgi:hypothetical protein